MEDQKNNKPTKAVHIGDVQPTVNYTYGKFRLHSISCLEGINEETHEVYFSTKETSYGLGLECKCGEKNYYVIATIHPDKDGNCSYTTVGGRVEDSVKTLEDLQAFQKLISWGYLLVSRSFLRKKGELEGSDSDDLDLLNMEGVTDNVA